jgi:glycosyltransferase involved in cell wall biosynthesis
MYKPLSFEQKQEVKDKYAQGAEYFVFAGALHPRKNVVNLLKAFAYFKSKQRSNMKLLIVGRYAWNYEEIKNTLDNHPFKKDVIMYDYMQVNELSKVIGAAYCLAFVSLFEGFGIPILEGLRSAVPVIAANTSSLTEVGGDAALYFNFGDIVDLCERMREAITDEEKRKTAIEKGLLQAMKFDTDKFVTQMEKLFTI